MRAVRFHEHGGPDVLQVDEVDRPTADAGEVVVEVHGAGVNPVDTYFRDGSYEPSSMPMTPGVDVAGEVVEVGDGVEGVSEGDSVFGTGLGSGEYGGYAEYAAVPNDRLAVLPDGVDTVAAGGAGVAALTAWRALIGHAGLEPAETVLIHGGSGGVGHAAVQIATATGAHVITTAAPDYHEQVSDLGADAVLDYGRDDLADAVREASIGGQAGGDGGVDVILDHRLDDYFQFDADVANLGARVVGIGENDPHIGLERSSAARSKDVQFTLMSMFNTPNMAAELARLGYLFGEDGLSIHVARTYDLDEAAEAQRAVLEDSFLGKLVLTP